MYVSVKLLIHKMFRGNIKENFNYKYMKYKMEGSLYPLCN